MVPEEIENLLAKKIIICVGPGGVGKTTVSAMLGLTCKKLGKKAICVTVDPSERLAESLGLRKSPAPEPGKKEIYRRNEPLENRIHNVAEGLDAMIIHGPWVIDRALSKYIPEDKWEIVSSGRIYPYMRQTLRGMHELASMVLVNDLLTMNQWDCVIVDTAPSAHAIDFLEMPRRIIQAIRSPAVRIFMRGSPVSIPGAALLSRASALILRAAGRIVGADFLTEVAQFLTLNKESLENICTAAESIKENLRGGGACIVQVTSAKALSVDETLFLHDKISGEGFFTLLIAINRVLPLAPPPGGENVALEERPETGDSGLDARIARNFEEMCLIAQVEEKEIERLTDHTPTVPSYLKIPLLEHDVYSIPMLNKLLDRIEVHHP
ncbi:MAG: ArsA-related P-loop ATPase [Pseudomonadota bacterium]